ATIQECLRRLRPDLVAERQSALERECRGVEQELTNLTRAIRMGGQMESLVRDLREREARKRSLDESLAALGRAQQLGSADLARLEEQLREQLQDWRGLLTKHVGAARQILRKLIPERLRFTPHIDGDRRWYTFEGIGRLEPMLAGMVPGAESLVRQEWWP